MDEQEPWNSTKDDEETPLQSKPLFLAFEPLPPPTSKFFQMQEAIVEPNLFAPTSKSNPILRFLITLLFALVIAGTVWLGYDYFRDHKLHNEEYEEKISKLSLENILADKKLLDYTLRTAAPLFASHCADCHGANGEGNQTDRGLFAPILNDSDWLFDNQIDNLYTTIVYGSRAMMPGFRKTLSEKDIDNVARFVKAMSEGLGDKEPAGRKVFLSAGCTDCHGETATGSKSLGAVNLTDSIWRFEGTLDGIRRTINYGVNSGDPNDRISNMPSFAEGNRLNNNEIKKLAIYVSKLPELAHHTPRH